MTDEINKTIEAIQALLPGESSLEHWKSGTENPSEKEYYGEFCTPDQIEHLIALAAELKQLREFVGAMHNFVLADGTFGCEVEDGVWHLSDVHDKTLATGTDPFDAWRKMKDGGGE